MKKTIRGILFTMLLSMLLSVATQTDVFAKVSNLRWDNMIAKWDAVSGASDYWVTLYKEDSDGNYYMVGPNGFWAWGPNYYDASEIIMAEGVGKYKFDVIPYIDEQLNESQKSDFSPVYKHVTRVSLSKPTNLRWEGQVAKWDAVSGASQYIVYLYFNNKLCVNIDCTTTENSWKLVSKEQDIIGLYGKGEYAFEVMAYASGKQSSRSDKSPVLKIEPSKPVSTQELGVPQNAKWRGKTATWGSVSGAESYIVYVYRDGVKAGVEGYQVSGYCEFDVSSIMSSYGAGDYTFRVVAQKAGKISMESDLSSIKEVRPKKTSISKIVKGKKSFTVTWAKKTTGITGYQIQYCTSSKFKTKVKTVTILSKKTNTKKIKKLKKKTKYYVRVRTIVNVNGRNHYSDWSAKKAVKTL